MPGRVLLQSSKSGLQILCVGDDVGNLHLRKLVLESRGYSVRIETSQSQVLAAVASASLDLVVADFLRTRGDALLAEMKQQNPHVAIIAVCERGCDGLQCVDAHVDRAEGAYPLLRVAEELLSRKRESNPDYGSAPNGDAAPVLQRMLAAVAPISGVLVDIRARVETGATDVAPNWRGSGHRGVPKWLVPATAVICLFCIWLLWHETGIATRNASPIATAPSGRQRPAPEKAPAVPTGPQIALTPHSRTRRHSHSAPALSRSSPPAREEARVAHGVAVPQQEQPPIEELKPVPQLPPAQTTAPPPDTEHEPQPIPDLGNASESAAPPVVATGYPASFLRVRSFKAHSGWVTGVSFSVDGQHLASGGWDHRVRLWDVKTGKEVGTLPEKVDGIQTVAFSRDGRWLAAEAADNTVTLWDAGTGRKVRALPGDRPWGLFAGSNWVYSIAFSPDGRWLASGVDNHTVRLWDVKTGRPVRDLAARPRSVIYVAFSPDGHLLASGGDDKTIRIWDTATGRVLLSLRGHSKEVYAVAFSPDGRLIASGSGDKTVKIWDVSTGRELQTLRGHKGWVTSLAFSSDGRFLASGSWDNTVKIWNITTGSEEQTLEALHHVYTIAFSPDARLLADGSEDGTIELWRLTEASGD